MGETTTGITEIIGINTIDEEAILNSLVDQNGHIDTARAVASADKIESFCKFPDGTGPDVVVVLGGGVEHVTDVDQITDRSPRFSSNDNNGLTSGSVYRVYAAAIISKIFNSVEIETNSGNFPDEQTETPAEIMSQELTGLGVEVPITVEPHSLSTFGNMIELVRLLKERPNWKNIMIITNEYHVARVNEILIRFKDFAFDSEKNDPDYQEGIGLIETSEVTMKVVPCEEIIQAYEPSFERSYQQIKKTAEFQQRLAREQHGISQLQGKNETPYRRSPIEQQLVQERLSSVYTT